MNSAFDERQIVVTPNRDIYLPGLFGIIQIRQAVVPGDISPCLIEKLVNAVDLLLEYFRT